MNHEKVEKNVGLMGILIAVVISFGGLAEIVPLMFQAETIEPMPGMKPYPALELAGRDVYVREGCYNCHSQMVRTLRFETERYGHYSLAGESVYDRPFQWGSKRTGPDLARVGGRYSDDWHRVHLLNPRDVVPESNMPGYPWLQRQMVDPAGVVAKMRTLRALGDPYTEADIEGAALAVGGYNELDALVAYLQGLGRHAPKPGAVPPVAVIDADATAPVAVIDADATAPVAVVDADKATAGGQR
jgi:cytochrome c oxidase cbb3-type subunit II